MLRLRKASTNANTKAPEELAAAFLNPEPYIVFHECLYVE